QTGDTTQYGAFNTLADYKNLGRHPGGFPLFAYLESDGSIHFNAFNSTGSVPLYQWQVPLDAFNPGNINNQTGSLAFSPADGDTLIVLFTAKYPNTEDNVFYFSKGTLPGSFVMEETVPALPLKLSVYPNPFKTEVALGIEAQKAQSATVEIYNIRGQKVRSLTDITLSIGENTIRWDGTNDRKQAIGSGIYLVRVRNRDGIVTRKILKL
ncbi:MAG: T9SS type A sorting domain-containing protein, partial [Candidatus Cloacimonadaceae bacterium]|nr:T9SS type A sorting domain-containing protein [Candidatus Cloacimonadaceae bacterium]